MLRIIDANLNRAAEGLRVLEDIARLHLNNGAASQRFKELRHRLRIISKDIQGQLLNTRQADKDVGREIETIDQSSRASPLKIAAASAKRVQEALRVLEEVVKMESLSLPLNSRVFKEMRFEVYTSEKELIQALTRKQKQELIRDVYAIIDAEMIKGRNIKDVVFEIIRGGANVVQYRHKYGSIRDILNTARELSDICRQYNVLFIVNDYVDIALSVDAGGVHLGQEDFPVKEVRRIIPPDMLVGYSANTIDKAKAAIEDGADYIAVGAVFKTLTKPGQAVVGIKRLKAIKSTFPDIPVVAIGGINESNLPKVIEAGADSAAVISAILLDVDTEVAIRDLVSIYQQYRKEKAEEKL